MDQDTHTQINWMDREQLQAVLEEHGFAVHDTESDDELREAVRVNLADGTIDIDSLPDAGPSAADRALSRSLR